MTRIPFGVSRLDANIGGGAPAGSVVLLAGEAGAGAREFLYTCAVMNGLQSGDTEQFDLHYGALNGDAVPPDDIHYVSFTADAADLHRGIGYTMDDDIVEAGLDPVRFADFSTEFFQLSPVPREWYAGSHRTIHDLAEGEEDTRSLLSGFANYLDEHASGSLVLVDSLADLIGGRSEVMSFADVVTTLKGLRKAARAWDGLILLHANLDALRPEELGHLMTAVDGTIQFEWERGGNERVRTMFFREFRGVLSQLEEEDIIQFETEIHDAGFDISNVRKIR